MLVNLSKIVALDVLKGRKLTLREIKEGRGADGIMLVMTCDFPYSSSTWNRRRKRTGAHIARKACATHETASWLWHCSQIGFALACSNGATPFNTRDPRGSFPLCTAFGLLLQLGWGIETACEIFNGTPHRHLWGGSRVFQLRLW